ncbi:hypothetical protein Afil01_21770 [Actinorhabdospora filicis]|uniref:Uncharacterized protein n=1 Tax=Actinorhabdospora filicis TaxID=1785913 RepID=A0A9W6SK22_9ACTN|nr:hypothetical protein [Actinorhabdospora filicis]GLZ77370.1 hypothetical protein Afil01_21770 [Actinorhabdospora filicis]
MTGVRDELARLAGEALDYADAEVAIRRAHRRRVRNTVASVATAVLVAIGTAVPVLWLRDAGEAAPTSEVSPSPDSKATDGVQLYRPNQTIDGVALPPGAQDKTGEIGRVWRTAHGVVLMGTKGTYFAYNNDPIMVLLAPAGTPATVSADGRFAAWVGDDGAAWVADLSQELVTGAPVMALPQGVRVQQWAGDRLVLTNAARARWMLWRPGDAIGAMWQDGEFRTSDGAGTMALVIDGTGCLVRVNLSTLGEEEKACDGSFTVVEASPDLKWLWLERNGQHLLADGERFFQDPVGVRPIGAMPGQVVWSGRRWVMVSADGTLLRVLSTSGSVFDEMDVEKGTVLVEMPSG